MSSYHNSTAEKRGRTDHIHNGQRGNSDALYINDYSPLSLAMRKSLPNPPSTLPDIYTYFTDTPPTH